MARSRRKGPGGSHQHRTTRLALSAVSSGRPSGDSESTGEISAVMFLAGLWVSMPQQPACEGPVLVHEDGSFECHGPGCPGSTAAFHGEDAIENCRYRGLTTWSPCSRCAT
jgi:hypothetical protein